MTTTIVLFIGPAGSGKSSLVASYSKWLKENLGSAVFIVNLDPATEVLLYKPDIDVRAYVDVHEVAKKFGLGPNGALVKSMDMVADMLSTILEPLSKINVDFVLIDTPGQMEVFVFRDIAIKLVEELKKYSNQIVALFILDAETIKRYEDYAFLSIMSTALQARLGVDVIPIINKVDLAPTIPIVGDVVSDVDMVLEHLKDKGLYGEMLSAVLNTIWLYAKGARVPRVSAKEFIGLEELHRVVHEVTCACGDLT